MPKTECKNVVDCRILLNKASRLLAYAEKMEKTSSLYKQAIMKANEYLLEIVVYGGNHGEDFYTLQAKSVKAL